MQLLTGSPLVSANQHRHIDGELPVDLGERVRQLLANRGAAELEHRLIGERGEARQGRPTLQRGRPAPTTGPYGAASKSSRGVPCARSCRKLSFDVFSSKRRTR